MTDPASTQADPKFLTNAMTSFIQIGALIVMLYWCGTIILPFVTIITWALILSVAVYPTHVALSSRLGEREKLSATILVIAGLSIILVPALLLADSMIGSLNEIGADLGDGAASIPPPADSVRDWPVIGRRLHETWSAAAADFESFINQFGLQLRSFAQKVVGFTGHLLGSALQFAIATIIAGVLLLMPRGGYEVARDFATALVGKERGPEFTDLSIITVRSVAKGVLGVAIIQAALAAAGLVVAGIPAAGLLTGLVLVLAVVQLPPLIVLAPIAVWYYTVADPLAATVFLVYATCVSFSDVVLKPLLLGRGVEIPMLVILIGAIGGAITYGVTGLFEGAVVLALGYKIFMAWISPATAHAGGEPDRNADEAQ